MKKFLINIFAIVLCVGISSSGCSYSSKSNKVLKNNEIAVPEGKDSFCKSVILSSLLPVIDDDSNFIERQKNLFGKNMEIDRVEFGKNAKDIDYLRSDEIDDLVEAFCDNNEIDLDEDDIDDEFKDDLCERMKIQINEFFFDDKKDKDRKKVYKPDLEEDDDQQRNSFYQINIIRDHPDTTKRKSKRSKRNPKRKKTL